MENKIQGLMVKPGNVNFVKAKLGFKKEDFIKYLNSQSGEWVNIDILESKNGDLYPKLNDWKPKQATSPSDGSPF
jgi:hypothetical protein